MLTEKNIIKNLWTKESIWHWYRSKGWLSGFNYISSTAVNSTEMWQKESFDEKTIAQELKGASEIGFNSCRVFLQYLVWQNDPQGLKERINRFLDIVHTNGLLCMPILFDDCAFSYKEPYLGIQDYPSHGIHNSQWTPSPGPCITDDERNKPLLECYVKDIISTFGNDERVVVWDLYNEPGNSGREEKSLWLLCSAFEWARDVGPVQPLTSGVWRFDKLYEIEEKCLELSDIISFHCYQDITHIRHAIDKMKSIGLPMLCTEWLHRPFQSHVDTHLPLLKKEGIASYIWGMVNGRTQTHYLWQEIDKEQLDNPDVWQHDILYSDGTPYCSNEINVFKNCHSNKIQLNPVEMTPDVMSMLEKRGLIYRLFPGRRALDAKEGQTLGQSIYECNDSYGPHKLIAVAVNRCEFTAFGTHPDNEDFLLIGEENTKPLYLVISIHMKEILERKIREQTLCDDDFITLKVRYNDPEVSFFTMLGNVPHGEAVAAVAGRPASFYVGESRDLPLEVISLGRYKFKLD